MRKPPSLMLVVAIVPALVVAPTIATPQPAPHPVTPRIQTIPLHGVDQAALSGLEEDADPEVLTAPLSTAPFQLAGITWSADRDVEGVEVSVRVHDDAGWGEWQSLEIMDIGPDPRSPEARATSRTGTEPLITDSSDGVQVMVDTIDGRVPTGLRLSLIDPGSSAADAHIADRPPASAQAMASKPTIISRAAWGADERLRNSAPRYSPTVKVGFVHHTATSNNYTGTSGAAAQIRSIYAYDTDVLGWSDIGYNFLVDKAGNIYEGRYGGVDKAVIGAHTAGFNADTFAVSALGCFDSSCSSAAKPSSGMIDAIGRVMGWKLGLFNVDPLSQQTLVSDGLYGTNTRYPEGTAVRLQAVSMHRDVGSTACPGNYLKDYVHSTIANKARATQGSMLYSPSVNTASRAYGSSTGFTVSATTPRAQSWSLKVYGKCSTWPLRTLTGSTSGNVVSAYWDLRTDGGAFVIPGSYRLELSSPGSITWNHDVTVSATMASPSSDCVTMRLAGDTRWQTSAIVGGEVNPSGTTVVVVSSKPGHLVDGVVAAPFAHALGAPILLSDGSSLAADVVVELKRRGATKAYVIGGPIALSSAVDDQLRSLGITPVRVAGDTAYDTSAKVASAAKSLGVMGGKVFVASSASGHLVDALTAGSAGVGLKMPVLLMSRDYVPEATKQALRDLGASSAVLLGGDLAISSKGYSMLKSLVPVTRIAGSTAFDTSAMIADLAARSQPTDTITLVSRDPDALVDALSGGAFGRIMLLSARTSLSTATSKWVAAHDVSQVRVIGGPLAISQGVVDGLDETLR